MPLTGSDTLFSATLYTSINAALASTGAPPLPTSAGHLKAFCDGLAQAILAHLLLNGTVAPGQAVVTNTGAGATSTPGVFL